MSSIFFDRGANQAAPLRPGTIIVAHLGIAQHEPGRAKFPHNTSLESQSKSLWILGINQDRNQAAFRIYWVRVHDPGPKGIGSPGAGIRPRSSEVIGVT